jgi:voltage-gated potassium channel
MTRTVSTSQIRRSLISPGGLSLLAMIYLFVIPLLKEDAQWLLSLILISLIFYMAALNMVERKKLFLFLASFAVLAEVLTELVNLPYLKYIARVIRSIFFVLIVFRLIVQVARTESVQVHSVLHVLNGYLLLGIIFSGLVTFIDHANPSAYQYSVNNTLTAGDYNYYTFITLTTVGYGDILPSSPVAKSVAVLIAVSGQFYVAVIIALIVGKFAGSVTSKHKT